MTTTVPSVSVQTLRRDIAACSRMLVDQQILNYSGHMSVRVPGTQTFLIQSHHDVRASLEPDRLLIVNYDGKVVEGDSGKPPSEVFIHAEILRSRSDVNAVAHFHHDPTTVFSLVTDVPMVAMKNHASRWSSGIKMHRDPSHIDSPQKGREVVQTLGNDNALVLRGHGEVIVAEDVRALFIDSVHFVENAAVLALAAQLGTVDPLTEAEQQKFLATFDRPKHVSKLWKYYVSTSASRGVLPREWSDSK